MKRVDKNGTEITAKYTPTVIPVTPTAAPAETTDIQGATQTGKPEFTAGDSRVPMNVMFLQPSMMVQQLSS